MIVVNGGTGFVGAACVRALAAAAPDEPLRVTSRTPDRHRDRFPGLPVEMVTADVLRPDTLHHVFEGATTVVNAVQLPGYPVEVPRKGLTFARYDEQGTRAQVAAAEAAGVKRFVYVSAVGADPASAKPWYRAKGRAEAAVTASAMAWTVLRPAWLYGPEDNGLNRFVTISRLSPVMPVVGSGNQPLQPAFVDDLAGVVATAATGARLEGEIVEVGGPETLTMNEVLTVLLEVLGRRRPLIHVTPVLPKLAGRGAMLLPRPMLSAPAIEFLLQDAVVDRSALDRLLPGAVQTTLRDGLRTYLPRRS